MTRYDLKQLALAQLQSARESAVRRRAPLVRAVAATDEARGAAEAKRAGALCDAAWRAGAGRRRPLRFH